MVKHKLDHFLTYKFGRNNGIRTRDLFVPNEARYQTAPYSDGSQMAPPVGIEPTTNP